MGRVRPVCETKYVVDGVRYSCVFTVWKEAVARGFNGCEATIGKRLKAGKTTFAEIARPVNKLMAVGGKNSQLSKRREIADAIAALDARKAEMGLS